MILLAAAASAVSSAIWITYYKYQPLWVEHAAYGMMANVTFADALATQGYWRALGAPSPIGMRCNPRSSGRCRRDCYPGRIPTC